jgi:hypothetical protein
MGRMLRGNLFHLFQPPEYIVSPLYYFDYSKTSMRPVGNVTQILARSRNDKSFVMELGKIFIHPVTHFFPGTYWRKFLN